MPDVREKLVELLRSVPRREEVSIGRGSGKSFIWLGSIADHLIANGMTIQRWIPVEERLPETFATVLIYNGNQVHEAILQKDRKWLAVFGDSLIMASSDVTHWMPLPEPPKEE